MLRTTLRSTLFPYTTLFRSDETHWSLPLNLGPMLNTAGDELTPFLAPDGRTLYFSTNGRSGFGKHDIFLSRRSEEHTSELQSQSNLVCRLLLEKKNYKSRSR